MKLTITLGNGGTQTIEAKKFSHYIGGVRYWFAYHKSLTTIETVITHVESGVRVTSIPHMTLAASYGDTKHAAKMTLDELVARVGAPRVRSALDAAAKLAN